MQIPLRIQKNESPRIKRMFNIVQAQTQTVTNSNPTHNCYKIKFQNPETNQHSPRTKSVFGQKCNSNLTFGQTKIIETGNWSTQPKLTKNPKRPPTPPTPKPFRKKNLHNVEFQLQIVGKIPYKTKTHCHSSNKSYQIITHIYLTDIYTRPMDTTLIEAIKNNRPYIQNQALYKGRQMSKIIKGKLDRKNESDTSWLVTKITKFIIKPVKDIGLPVLSL